MTYRLVVETMTLPDLSNAMPDEPLRLSEAVWLPSLGRRISEKIFRTAIANGDLRAERLGRTLYVTPAAIAEWRENAAVTPAERSRAPEPRRDDGRAAASRAKARSALAALKDAR
ncbi:hypothetical protein SAMN06297251_10177 [Fulvimarina manganoxydans]|uniref:Helix-turn-helix domain-containing protein n=1 Tax=Fulvimarina manganoxydans TaxID=937218 RepID=A0A1W1Y9B5_9HYPH|nr:hypothetical protein [Fulvimarina manganoxydans]SMC32724.1 hypothetical protein SAMN06297251_10177 [Fulvimarina manganoxydans]